MLESKINRKLGVAGITLIVATTFSSGSQQAQATNTSNIDLYKYKWGSIYAGIPPVSYPSQDVGLTAGVKIGPVHFGGAFHRLHGSNRFEKDNSMSYNGAIFLGFKF